LNREFRRMPSIEALSLTKKYGPLSALSDLNLKIEGTKCVGFLGPNGSGKTTTLKLFTDLIRPTKGEVLINGANVRSNKKKALESVGALIETPEIYPSLTPREALTMIAEIRGVPSPERRRQVEAAVSEVRMDEWIDKRVGKFSKGMKQRICVASALLSDPDVILLDEPTAGLDPRGMSEVRGIIKALKSKDRLVFMSSHLLSEVSDVCDEVAMIDRGKLIIYDTIPNVTSKFSGGNNVVEVGLRRNLERGVAAKAIAAMQGVIKVEEMDGLNIRIVFNGGLETQERLLGEVAKLGIGAISYRAASSELEEVYLKLIKNTA
jgi:ABC-2 type transport system ATP-binding protein